jgi:hypothetical protein
VGTELFHANRQTDVTKLMITFCNFGHAPNNEHFTRRPVYILSITSVGLVHPFFLTRSIFHPKNVLLGGVFAICYFLKLLHILIAVKMQKNIIVQLCKEIQNYIVIVHVK